METNSEKYLENLHSLIAAQFDLAELKTVCLEFDVSYDELWGDNEQDKVWELLQYLIHDGRLADLLALLSTKKPQVTWPLIPDDFEFPHLQEAAMGAEALESVAKSVSIGGDQIGAGNISDSTVAMGEGAAVHVFSGDFQGANITILPTPSADDEKDPAPLIEEEIRLDVATPTKVVEDQGFDIAVAVRQPASPPLSVEDLTAVTSGEGAIFRTEADEVVLYRIEVSGSGFTVEPESYTIRLRPQKDSRIYFFQLTPIDAGKKTIVVNAYQEDETLAAQTRIRIEVVVAEAGE